MLQLDMAVNYCYNFIFGYIKNVCIGELHEWHLVTYCCEIKYLLTSYYLENVKSIITSFPFLKKVGMECSMGEVFTINNFLVMRLFFHSGNIFLKRSRCIFLIFPLTYPEMDQWFSIPKWVQIAPIVSIGYQLKYSSLFTTQCDWVGWV